ncbi:hypothetical protein I3843_05G164500 [Carya illinoinensis]|uniref:Peroxidase n=1 Tax=Carya illinoinensis TaxID=32201 RepID=A0A8T1QJX6_CARIL|nr:peroxidase 5-like [Carya illinoinensis]KAG2708191.1 hypothetical protein I3760_05G180500 [Carya illinoinensis]KAG6654988.1 hypothetical protein CIPAW_05G183800 [Carya illinoinensis]KAG7980107.1 hypothetical protein I3843_05G164500 [Carya illinoinensis]
MQMGVGGHVSISTIFIFVFFSILLSSSEAAIKPDGNDFHVGFYRRTCPRAEEIVADVVLRAMSRDPGIAAGIIRLFFHDCFVNGCDASILLDSTPSGAPVEKESPANGGTLRGLEVIDEIKAQVEQECPGVVSCADILAFASRDAALLSGLSNHRVPAGRRDGLSSRAADTLGNLPSPSSSINYIAGIFATKGLSLEEMVILTGAHSIGVSHCSSFDYRLYNFSSTQRTDPDLDMLHASYLSAECPGPQSLLGRVKGDRAVNFDHLSPHRLDNAFYVHLLQGTALLQSDQAMANDPKTSRIVHRMAFHPIAWSRQFARAIIRLGSVDVLTGTEGEIRKNCRSVN